MHVRGSKEKDEVEKEEVQIGNHHGCRKQKCFMVQLFQQTLNTVSRKANCIEVNETDCI